MAKIKYKKKEEPKPETTPDFKIGDRVVGNRLASTRYAVTKEGWVGTVEDIQGDHMRVSGTYPNGFSFRKWVHVKYFSKADTDLSTKFKHTASGVCIRRVIFNKPATIVFWSDGTKTVVKCQRGDNGRMEKYDKEKGLAMCIAKKVLGNNYEYYQTLKMWVTEEEEGNE